MNKLEQRHITQLIERLEEAGSGNVKHNVANNKYLPAEIPHIKEWLLKKEDPENYNVHLYHEIKSPNGKSFKASRMQEMKQKGWVVHPNGFGKSKIIKLQKVLIFLTQCWLRNWGKILSIIIAIIAIVVRLFIYFDTTEAQTKASNQPKPVIKKVITHNPL